MNIQPLPGSDASNQPRTPTPTLPGQLTAGQVNPAADLIRNKISALYEQEPSAVEEQAEMQRLDHLSKHQQFMFTLSNSGKSLAQIQTEWHEYYVALPDNEKHQVWQEFYANHEQIKQASAQATPKPEPVKVVPRHRQESLPTPDPRSTAAIKEDLLRNVASGKRPLTKSDHAKSILFGLSMGAVTVLIFLFGFFNERFIAPFITPSKAVNSAPIVIDPSSTAAGTDPRIIIPKINVDIPVVYDEPSIAEDAVQKALERGALHYATTPKPGEIGNGAIFGHSSNNILNEGSYKFAFVLLNRLQEGDTFFLQKEGKRYAYKVYKKQVVKPSQVDVLNSQEKPATFTLITCDPPGSSINRLVVVGEQISPDPTTNVASTASSRPGENTAELPSNAPSLWSRITSWLRS